MRHTTLIVPGFHGSGPAHWQSWLEAALPDARRVAGIDWEAPVLARWAGEVRREIDQSAHAVWLVAHSFGCLASVVAAVDRPDKVAGAMLVAPADPQRFSPLGLRAERGAGKGESVAPCLPTGHLGFPSLVVASRDDPWLDIELAQHWAERWGSRFVDIGQAGHINSEAGFGPWPAGLALLEALQASHDDLPLGAIDEARHSHKGRRSALARLRHQTRSMLDTRSQDAC